MSLLKKGISLLFVCASVLSASDEAVDLKDYMIKKHPDSRALLGIFAENENTTIFQTKDENVMLGYDQKGDKSMKTFIEDSVGYCNSIGGKSIFGDVVIDYMGHFDGQRGEAINNMLGTLFHAATDDDVIKSIKAQEKGAYSGFYECKSEKDGFRILDVIDSVDMTQQKAMQGYRASFFRYYYVEHDKQQKLGYIKKWINANEESKKYHSRLSFKDMLSDGVGKHNYGLFDTVNRLCSFNNGEVFISSQSTDGNTMELNNYIAKKLKGIIDNNNSRKFRPSYVIDDKEYIWCKNTSNNDNFKLIHDRSELKLVEKEAGLFLSENNINPTITSELIAPKNTTQELSSADNIATKQAGKLETDLALNTIKYKQDIFKTSTLVNYDTSYNGIVDDCALSSVIAISNTSKRILNFKKCANKDLEYIGESQQADMEVAHRELQKIEKNLIQNCNANGQAITLFEESGMIAKCTQNPNAGGVKIVISKDDEMLLKTVR